MSLSATSDGALLSSPRIRLDGGFHVTETAATGVVGISDVLLDDETGDLDVVGLRPIFLDESAASPQRIFTGSHWDRDISRGPYRAGPSRQYACRVRDQNERLVRRIIRSADGKRPAETDLARLTWLLGHASMTGLVADLGLANATDNPINLDESDYRHRYPMDVFADMCPIAGKTSFVYYDESSDSFGLFYDKPGATGHDSTLRLSNDMADYDGTTTFYPSLDAVMTRTPEDLYSGIDYGYLGDAYVYRHSLATIATYEERDFTYSTTRVGRLATATANADQFLSDHGTEADQIAVSVTLPNTAVNGIRAGMRLSVKFTHIPGFQSFTWTRVVQRDIRQLEGDATQYVLSLLLSTSVFVGITGGGGGGVPQPPGDSCASTSPLFDGVTSSDYTAGSNGLWDSSEPVPSGQFFQNPENAQTGSGDVSTLGSFVGGGPATYRSWIECDVVSARAMLEMTAVLNFSTTGTVSMHIWGSNTPMPATNPTRAYTGGPYPDPSTEGWTEIAGAWDPTGIDSIGTFRTFTPTTAPTAAFRYWIIEWQKTTSGLGFVGGGQLSEWRGTACTPASENPPSPGQWVYNELVTLTAGAGTAANPFIDGTLHVRYDIIDQTPAIVSYDGATGDFAMPSQPPLGTQVFIDYQAR